MPDNTPVREQVSPHLVAILRALSQKRERWSTSSVIAEDAGISPRTTRSHLLRLARRGVVEWVEPFGGNRYRLREDLSAEAAEYVAEVHRIGEVLES
jgi:DNA-binding IclR family transcriptional regulator